MVEYFKFVDYLTTSLTNMMALGLYTRRDTSNVMVSRYLTKARALLDSLLYLCMIMNTPHSISVLWFGFMVLNATFNNISVISWQSVLLLNETGLPTENHRPVTSN